MRQSLLFTKTLKEISSDEISINASLLRRAGFIDRLTAGVYTYLPLGLIVLNKINNIIREEINQIGGQEVLMPGLTPKEPWEITGRWETEDALFKLKGVDDKEYALGATHEEVVVPLVQNYVSSYKDLPLYVYQIQTKFRNEKRAKAGILRGREFVMKDLYSFHTDEADLNKYYEIVKQTYIKIFERLDISKQTYLTFSLGGSFSKYSHEFQTISESGEDTIYICHKCNLAFNEEVFEGGEKKCFDCGSTDLEIKKAIETGNIFKLGTRYTLPFKFDYVDRAGKKQPVIMGCYGLGPTRSMGAIVETHYDDKGIIWPAAVAPFDVHLLILGKNNESIAKKAEELYNDLTQQGTTVLFDDREESAGIKLKDSDLIGLPIRLVISEKTLAADSVEMKYRNVDKFELIKLKEILKKLQK